MEDRLIKGFIKYYCASVKRLEAEAIATGNCRCRLVCKTATKVHILLINYELKKQNIITLVLLFNIHVFRKAVEVIC